MGTLSTDELVLQPVVTSFPATSGNCTETKSGSSLFLYAENFEHFMRLLYIYTHCRDLMKPVGCAGNLSLPCMMKVMVLLCVHQSQL